MFLPQRKTMFANNLFLIIITQQEKCYQYNMNPFTLVIPLKDILESLILIYFSMPVISDAFFSNGTVFFKITQTFYFCSIITSITLYNNYEILCLGFFLIMLAMQNT